MDLNGLVYDPGNPSVISNVTINNTTSGFGLALSGTDGVQVSGLSTSGNAWGSVGIWAWGGTEPDNIQFLDAVNYDESGGIQIQQDDALDPAITFSTDDPSHALFNAFASLLVPLQ